MAQSVIPVGGDQDGGKQNISHFLVEEVQPVVRLCHQSRFGRTCVVVLRALHKKSQDVRVTGDGSHPSP